MSPTTEELCRARARELPGLGDFDGRPPVMSTICNITSGNGRWRASASDRGACAPSILCKAQFGQLLQDQVISDEPAEPLAVTVKRLAAAKRARLPASKEKEPDEDQKRNWDSNVPKRSAGQHV